jgi:hypothetical protein
MSVTNTYEPVLLTGDGSETEFDFDFKIFDDSDLVVALVDPDTLEATSQELGVDYTVVIDTATVGGTVTFVTAPEDEILVSIRRDIPVTQDTDIPSGGLFREVQIENALDKEILVIQQLQEQVDRAVLQNPYSEAISFTLPSPVALKGLAWNSDGDGLENVDLPATAQAAAEAAQAAAEAAQAAAETAQGLAETASTTAQAAAALFTKATQEEAEAGVEDTHYMTALKTHQAINTSKLTENTTVNFTSAMTTAQIQALIDAQPKNLNGYSLTFQFADGSYTTTAALTFSYFHGGNLFVYGNTGESGLHTNQAVIVNSSASSCNTFYFLANSAWVRLFCIKAVAKSSAGYTPAKFLYCQYSEIEYNYFLGDSTASGYGVLVDGGCAYVYQNYVSTVQYGIQALGSRIFSNENDDTGTPPLYGISSNNAAYLGKYSTQPAGSTANENAGSGGSIV